MALLHLKIAAIALHSLTFIQSQKWKKIIAKHCDLSNEHSLSRFKKGYVDRYDIPLRNFSLVELLPQANKINKFMATYPINYDQALAWLKPEIQILLLQFKFHPDCLALITTYLSPIAANDALELHALMTIQIYKSFIITDLQKYVNNHDSGHIKRASSLLEACKPLTNKKALHELLDTQKTIISGNRSTLFGKAKHEECPKKPIQGKYLEIIERHSARL